jgi:outer membrane receptor protein involved in Fe transport
VEEALSKSWKLDLGARLDTSSYHADSLSPRAALLYQRSGWTYKFLYGRGFRDPSALELYFDDGSSGAPNPEARAESSDTVEVDVERKLGRRINLQASAYGYRLHNFLLGVYLPDGFLQYQNVGGIKAQGLELELTGRPWRSLEASASYAMQRSRDDTILENSPEHVAKLRFAVPWGRKVDISSGMQYQSRRQTLAGAWVTPVYLADFTLTTKHLLPNLDLRLGLRNAFNRRYADPIALNPVVDSMPQPGRSFFVELTTHQAR